MKYSKKLQKRHCNW